MGIGSAAGGGGILRVDPEMLQQLGAQLETSARALPDPPEPFPVTGADAISAAIAARLPALETPIIEGLPAVKEAATQTAQNIQTAAARYLGTDADLAAEYEKHRFDQTGAPGGGAPGGAGGPAGGGVAGSGGASPAPTSSTAAGSAPAAGGGGAMGQMSQLMGTPMQMASQASQLPQQALGSLGSMPQTAVQGVQQISQLAGDGKGDDRDGARPEDAGPDGARQDGARQDVAATGEPGGERAPVGEHASGRHAAEQASPATAVPDAGSAPSAPRHAKPDPTDL